MNRPDQDRDNNTSRDKDKYPKSSQFDFEDEDRDRQETRIGIDSKILNKAVDKLTIASDRFVPSDLAHWESLDRNQKHLAANTRKRADDFWLLLTMLANYIIDIILCHSTVKYMLELGIPNCPEIVLLIIGLLFPLVYLLGELEFNGKICVAKDNMDRNDLDRGAKVWFVLWCILGVLYALIPSASFAYVMYVAQADTSQSPLFIAILAILGIAIHTVVIFGGYKVTDFRTRFWAKWEHSGLARAWHKECRKTHAASNRVKRAFTHHTRSLGQSEFDRGFQPLALSPSTMLMIRFFDEGWYRCHPLDRPVEYQFGYRRNRRRDDDNDPRYLQ